MSIYLQNNVDNRNNYKRQNSLNLTNVQKSATSMLGMKKLDDSQKVYVSLPKKDYVEPASEQVVVTEEKGWFQAIIDKIADLF